MSTTTLPNIRVSSDLTVRVRLKDGGVAIDWSTLNNIKAHIYSDAQRALAGRCDVSVDAEDATLLVCNYAANKPQYVGVNRIVVSAKYMGETKTYDKPAFNFVRWTADQEGEEITIDDPDVDVEIEVEDVTSSILQEAIDAALQAAADAEHAAHLVPLEVLQDCEQATADAIIATAAANAAGIDEVQATVDAQVGTPSVDVDLENKVLSLDFHNMKGETGEAAGFGTASASLTEDGGDPGVTVSASGPDTAKQFAFTFKNLKGDKGDKGDQGNTGSSVDYPYELVNNLTTDDATKGLAASQGVALAGQVSQLEAKVDGGNSLITGWNENKYIATNQGIGNTCPKTLSSDNSWDCVIVNIETGKRYIVNGTGASTARLWCFLDANNVIISVSGTSDSASGDSLVLTPPENATQLIINTKTGGDSYIVSYGINQELNGIKRTLSGWHNDERITTNQGVGNTVPISYTSTTGWRCLVVFIARGYSYIVNATGGETSRAWCLLDADNKIVDVALSGENGSGNKLILTPPNNAVTLIINSTTSGDCYEIKTGELQILSERIDSVGEKEEEDVSFINATFTKMVGNYTRPGWIPAEWGTIVKEKYWNLVGGVAGLISDGNYAARQSLLSVNPGARLKVTVKNTIIDSTTYAAFAGYDNDGNPAYSSGTVARQNFNNADSALDNGDGTTTYTFTLGTSVTQIGLFYKSEIVTFYIEQSEVVGYSETLDQHIIDVAGGGDTTAADSASYYLKGASPKSFSNTKKKCILAAGQSNIDGRVPYANMPAEIQAAQPIANCKYVKNSVSDPFTPINITGLWGFDLVTYYNLALAREIYVIKWTVGGTSIDPLGDSSYHWTADYEKLSNESYSLLRSFENSIRNHIASDGENFDIRALLWHQGEGDRGSLGTGCADRYYDNLRNMISYIRGIVGNERLPIVTGTISENSAQYDATVHAAQVRLASEDPYFILIDMSGAPLLDSYHFNAASSIYLGEMAYNALIDLGVISGTKLTPTRPW